VAFFLDSPKIVQCFSATAGTNPALRKPGSEYELEFLVKERTVPAGDNVAVRFRLTDALTGWGKAGLRDVTVISFRAPSSDRRQTPAREVGDGEYEVSLPVPSPGAYYVYVTVPSLKIGVRDFVHLSLMAKEKGAKEPK
jgi:hypothetical protein